MPPRTIRHTCLIIFHRKYVMEGTQSDGPQARPWEHLIDDVPNTFIPQQLLEVVPFGF